MLINLCRNLKLEIDKITKNVILFLDSLRECRVLLKNFEEKNRLYKESNYNRIKISRLEKVKLKISNSIKQIFLKSNQL